LGPQKQAGETNMRTAHRVGTVLSLLASLALSTPAAAQYGMDKTAPKNTLTPELPHCDRPLGTAAVQEPDHRWWEGLGLSNPEVLLKLFASRSGCLRMVDRNAGLAMHTDEGDLARSGELQRGQNVGRGQVKSADYFIIPDIADSNQNAGGNNIGAVAGSLLPGGLGALAGGIRTKRSEAHVLITLVNARTTEQLYTAEGAAQKTDIGFEAGGGGFGASGFAALAGGGYSNTDIGKVITAAYFNAFEDLVHYMQSNAAPEPGGAAADAPIQAYRVTSPTKERTQPGGRIVRSFNPGDLVYPTGQKAGVWWEVDDENGNRGWVMSTMISPR
jgi:curli biogenesis system outer membrane secretion channel CsgG